jgi:hypothetical protein
MTVIINETDNAVGNPAFQGSTGGTTAGLYYPAANTVAITTSGVNALTISSTQAATFAGTLTTASQGIAFASLPTGSVLQVVQAVYKTAVSSTTSTYADTGLTATITPKFSTSKVLVLIVAAGVGKSTNNAWVQLKVQKNSVDLFIINQFIAYTASGAESYIGNLASNYLDSPASTSALTYKVQIASGNNNPTVTMNASNGADTSSITLMEIAG